ncbi:MAG: hypothetical protein AAF495_01460 [Pseudomonadota bacterium]
MRTFGGAGIASAMIGLLALAGTAVASDQFYDGKWLGAGQSVDAECPPFDFSVSVNGSAVEGVARQTGDEYRITGSVDADGEFIGEVEFLWMTIAELTGDIGHSEGEGAWRTLEGPNCSGTFWVRRG